MHTRMYNRRRMDEEIREEYSLSIDFRLQDNNPKRDRQFAVLAGAIER